MTINGNEIRKVREALNLSQTAFGEVLGEKDHNLKRKLRSIQAYESDHTPVPRKIIVRVLELKEQLVPTIVEQIKNEVLEKVKKELEELIKNRTADEEETIWEAIFILMGDVYKDSDTLEKMKERLRKN